MTSVAATSGSTPNFLSAKSGVHSVPVKNSTGLTCWKKPTAGGISETTIPTVVATETSADASSRALTTASP